LQATHTTGVTALPDTTPILAKYLDQLLNGETGDGRFVRVRAGKEFYLYPTETIEPQRRVVTDNRPAENSSSAQLSPAVSEAVELEKQILKASQQPQSENNNENQNRFHY
jgi:hypothetical protein